MLDRTSPLQRCSRLRRAVSPAELRRALRSPSGAIDLASIMVGVLVIGIIGSVIAVSVFAVIPWAQDEASKSDHQAVRVAQSVALLGVQSDGTPATGDGLYLTMDALVSADLLAESKSMAIALNEDASCYVAVSMSQSGRKFVSNDKAPAAEELTGSSVVPCITAGQLEGLITAVTPTPEADDPQPETPVAIPAVSTSDFKFGIATDRGADDIVATAEAVWEYPGVVLTYRDFSSPFDMSAIAAVSANGSIPMVTWEPFIAGAGIDQPDYTLAKLINGSHDAYIASVADQLVAAGNPEVSIRFAHEMNGSWYPWSEQTNGNSPGEYTQAWKRVVDIFDAKGLSNVDWVWAPNVPYDGGTDIAGLYPGTTYVDHTALDGFNFGTTDVYSTWRAPWDLFGSGLGALESVAPDKSIYIAETGSVKSEGANRQDVWISDMVYYLDHWGDGKPIQVDGFVWFNNIKYDELDVGQTSPTDWRFDSTPESLAAMKAALAARE